MKSSKVVNLVLALLAGLVFTAPSLAQENGKSATQITVEAGKKQKISGIVVRREGNNLVVRDRAKAEFKVNLAGTTKIQERKANPFRGSKKYDASSIVRGLWVEVE
ncbi:MAG: hypothetical protein ACRD9Y_26230, partial [Blastocatellia bacterium]